MSVRKLLPIALLLAAVSIRCAGSPSEPEGTVSVTVTTTTTTTTSTTTTVIPPLIAGGVSETPTGIGLAAATVFTFAAAPPSGGVPPYTFAWNFGDGAEGAGSAPTHVYANTGLFTVVVTATDSAGTSAQASDRVQVRAVTGRWTATLTPPSGLQPKPIDLVQNQTAVTATINEPAPNGLATGTGNVSNPRSLAVSATYSSATPPFAVSYVGQLNDTLTTWSGTVNGYPGCPCTFTATRP
jgi:PKD domain